MTDLITEGRGKLEVVDSDLLPLETDHTPNGDVFVCDRNGLEFAVPREADAGTAKLIAWAVNNLPALLDELEALREYRDIARDRRDAIVGLQAELGAKRAQHAETLGLLEHAYEVIEAQNRPPLGYLALSCTEDRLIPGAYHYTAACPITESVLPAERFVEEHAKRRKRYVVAELREVSE